MYASAAGVGREIEALTFGRFTVFGRVSDGSSGTLWKAHDPVAARAVAIKELAATLRGDGEFVARFRNEARQLARFDDPHIVRIYDFVETGDKSYIVEEWIEGASLAQVCSHAGTLSAEQALGVVRGALMGLATAHRAGVVHGGVDPSNIVVDLDGTSKLIDFGLSVLAGSTRDAVATSFQSPEAKAGFAVDARSDVYSAAATLYYLLTGANPPSAAADLPPIATRSGAHIDGVLRRALSAEPGQRPNDAEQFLNELENAAKHRFGAAWHQRASVAALVGAVTGGAATNASVQSGQKQAAQDPAHDAPIVAGAYVPVLTGETSATTTRPGRRTGVLLGVAAGVLLGVVALVIAVSASGDDRGDGTSLDAAATPADSLAAATTNLTVRPTATDPAAPTAPPSTPIRSTVVVTTTAAPAPTLIAGIYDGGSVIERSGSLTLTAGPRLIINCAAAGCSFQPPNTQEDVAPVDGRWQWTTTIDMGPVCNDRGRQQFIETWDLEPVGSVTTDGLDVPERVVGTYRMESPSVPDCLEGGLFVWQYDAVRQ